MELHGWEVMRDGGYGLAPYPIAVDTPPLWGEFLAQHQMRGVLYLGSPYNPASRNYFLARPKQWREMVDWTLDLAKRSGFDLVAIDALVRHGEGYGVDEPMRLYLLEQAEERGLRVVVEAWPHKKHESIFAGKPAWLTYDAFLTQHPKVAPHRWGQAPAESHLGLVVYGHWASRKQSFDAKIAREIFDVGCLPVIDWDKWEQFADQLPAKELNASKEFAANSASALFDESSPALID